MRRERAVILLRSLAMKRVLVATVALSLAGAGFVACGADDDHPPAAAPCVPPACTTVVLVDPPAGQAPPSPSPTDTPEGEPPEPIGGAGVVDGGVADADANPFFGVVDETPIDTTPVVPGGPNTPTTPVNPADPNPNPTDGGAADTGVFVVPIPI